MKTPGEIAQLVQMACIWEVCADKPGNVSFRRNFTGSSFIDFALSSVAIGPAFQNVDTGSIGGIVLKAVQATQKRVRSNTNLGIILLLAPLAKACCAAVDLSDVRKALHTVLRQLDVEDARLTYSAIRAANPGGMGKVEDADISENPSITLLQAMELSRDRDSIAFEYATDFAITFETGLPALKEAISRGAEFSRAIVQCYLTLLSRIPDTLIARKTDPEVSRLVSRQAERVLAQGGVFTASGEQALKEMDDKLRDPGHALNPGTTADLTAAAIFLSLFESSVSEIMPPGF